MTDDAPTDAGMTWRPCRCARCATAFDCGAALPADGPGCWCVTLPALPAPARDAGGAMLAGCLCPACLREEIARQRSIEDVAAGWPAAALIARDDAQ